MKDRAIKILKSYPIFVLCRLILGGIFIYASIDKITHPFAFAKILYNYQLLPDILIFITAAILPWIELIAGLFLVSGIFPKTSSIILSILLIVFAIALGFNALRGLDVVCGCFSTSGESGDPVFLIFRDLIMSRSSDKSM